MYMDVIELDVKEIRVFVDPGTPMDVIFSKLVPTSSVSRDGRLVPVTKQ
jgi:hypothetical protein